MNLDGTIPCWQVDSLHNSTISLVVGVIAFYKSLSVDRPLKVANQVGESLETV